MPQTERPALSRSQPEPSSIESLAAELAAFSAAVEAKDSCKPSLGEILIEASALGRTDIVALILSVEGGPPDPLNFGREAGLREQALLWIPDFLLLSDISGSISLALFQACSRGHAECVRLLAPKTPFNNVSNMGRGLVHLGRAAGANHLDCVKALLPFVNLTSPDALFEHPLPIAASKIGMSSSMLTFLADISLSEQAFMFALSAAARGDRADNASTLLSLLFSEANQQGHDRHRYAISSPEGRRLPSPQELRDLAQVARDNLGGQLPASTAWSRDEDATPRLFEFFAAQAEKMEIEASGLAGSDALSASKSSPRI